MKTMCSTCDKIVDFKKPKDAEIKMFVKDILKAEKITHWTDGALSRLVVSLNHDIRWILMTIQFMKTGDVKVNDLPSADPGQQGLYLAADKLLQPKGSTLSYDVKQSLLEEHKSIIPLFIQENYISMIPSQLEKKLRYVAATEKLKSVPYTEKNKKLSEMKSLVRLTELVKAAESLSIADGIDTMIRSRQAYDDGVQGYIQH